jgi:hypothetical protein
VPPSLSAAHAASVWRWGQIFITAGDFVGRFDRQSPSILGYRDHYDSPPWSVADLHDIVGHGEADKVAKAYLIDAAMSLAEGRGPLITR